MGRWTTPDPAATPWRNLVDYVNDRPTLSTDPSGLLRSGTALKRHSLAVPDPNPDRSPKDPWSEEVWKGATSNKDLKSALKSRKDKHCCDWDQDFQVEGDYVEKIDFFANQSIEITVAEQLAVANAVLSGATYDQVAMKMLEARALESSAPTNKLKEAALHKFWLDDLSATGFTEEDICPPPCEADAVVVQLVDTIGENKFVKGSATIAFDKKWDDTGTSYEKIMKIKIMEELSLTAVIITERLFGCLAKDIGAAREQGF
ncbi:MAG: hypothetical protein IPP14_16180 [Planctomycetes bacterium]|nr:hypothetical protein [Planctomycetota bacterium]